MPNNRFTGNFGHRSFQGQSLSEYGIAVSLIAVVSVGGIIVLQEDLRDAFSSLLPAPKSSFTPLTANIPAGQTVALTSPNSTGNAGSTSTDAGLAPVNIDSPEYLDLGQYPANLDQEIDVSGANGTTSKLLAVLDSTIAQALVNGQVTEEQSNALKALAEQGHRIGRIEAVIEDIIKNNPSALTKPLTFEGKQYHDALALVHEINVRMNGVLAPELAQMNSLLQQAGAQGALNDPTINTVVTTLSNQIMSLANGLSDATDAVKGGSRNSENYTDTVAVQMKAEWVGDKKTLLESGVAVVTHNKSTAICLTGGNGNSCNTGKTADKKDKD
ncbi:MAG: hypothetical protein VKJ04_02715 [Vampirovibrionales bacterium]|nr:hypothetical protein [Vampirovibrionales bacterium]